MIKVIVFDLDDTLYNEISFVKSGFHEVAEYLAPITGQNAKFIYNALVEHLDAKGRGRVFNDVLAEYEIDSKFQVAKCLQVYRSHEPNIVMNSDAIHCLNRFKEKPLYIVTDGNKIVQKAKIKALGVENYVKKAMATHSYGRNKSKPSTYCFDLICKWEKISPTELIYIGDNPNKDFVNLKKKGYKTIRIKQGMFADLQLSSDYEADRTIESLNELTENLMNSL
ncbi:MAG: HAD family hydrolase [Marinifilaceae bacterium]|jgi:putative hydrolase of the HAD superfamily|nr:HAD family hydrolase [Marinifilaceae bacterium]